MRTTIPSLLGALSIALPLVSALTALSLHLPPTQNLPQPQTLPPSTHARLTSTNTTLTAPFRRNSRFVFPSVPAGTYLCDVWSHDYIFIPMRVDVSASGGIEVWQTYRGNEWSNTGEKLGALPGKVDGRSDVTLEVTVGMLGQREFYEKRGGFDPMTLLKNPMVLIGVVGMAVMFGMPKLLENMDPEMREEFNKQQANSPLAALAGGGSATGGFDVAGWMAGTDKQQGSSGKASGADGGNAKRRR